MTGTRPGKDVLMVGPWPDPRAGGSCSAVHDTIKGLVEAGRDVLLVVPCPGLDGPRSLYAAVVPAGLPYDWKTAEREFQTFRGFRHLALADRLSALPGGPDRLAGVGVIHAQGDELLTGPTGVGLYRWLAAVVRARSGTRPKLVRTYHVDVDEVVDTVMSLSGVDYVGLPDDAKRAVLDGRVDLARLAPEHVAAHRDGLRASGYSDDVLDRAADRVASGLGLLRRWRAEVRTVDAAVSVSRRGARRREALLLPDRPGVVCSVENGTSFRPRLPGRARALCRSYRTEGLLCWRGGSADRERVRFGPTDRVVLFVGRAVRDKGIYELAAALGKIYHGSRFEHVRGIFAGEFGPSVRADLARGGPGRAGEHLLFTGYQCDPDVLASLYDLADVVALPSRFESFGLAAAEGLLRGTPCIVTEGTSAADVFGDRPARDGVRPGLTASRAHRQGPSPFSAVDAGSLARELLRLLTDDATSRQMGAEGRSHARRHFTYRAMTRGYLRLYEGRPGADPERHGPTPTEQARR